MSPDKALYIRGPPEHLRSAHAAAESRPRTRKRGTGPHRFPGPVRRAALQLRVGVFINTSFINKRNKEAPREQAELKAGRPGPCEWQSDRAHTP